MLAICKQRAVPAAWITPSEACMRPRSVFASSRCAPLLGHRRQQHRSATATTKCCSKTKIPAATADEGFWTSTPTWKRSGVNTLRCLMGCTTGDFSTMWYLQSAHPELSTVTTMSLSSEFQYPTPNLCNFTSFAFSLGMMLTVNPQWQQGS